MANSSKCRECGCVCKICVDHDVHLHVEIENLKQKLVERDSHIVSMETNFLNEANKFPSGEIVALREELLTWQDKYRRLYDAHRRVQRVNQGLEDKLLKLVDICETDKSTLTKDVANLSHKLAEANYAIKKLAEDNERYKNDVSLAIQFLQCKQSNFVAHKFDSLSQEVQVQISPYITNKKKPEEKRVIYEMKSIKVPIPTFPPTAMVYSVPKSPKPDRKTEDIEEGPSIDIVSAAIMAKVLEERQKERAFAKHCDSCTCSKKLRIVYEISCHSIGSQTGEYKNSVCLRCNAILNQNVRVVRTEPVKKPSEITETHVVKVQPNNFLIDESSSKASLTNSNGHLLARLEGAKEISSKECSMSSRNILLDNAQDVTPPVLYARHHLDVSGSNNSVVDSEQSLHNQQRVADWIQNNNAENEASSPENSRSDSLGVKRIDKAKYAEMEENVKRFLFGESEFMRTVEIGKLKYQNFRENDDEVSVKSSSHTETDM